MTMRGWMVMLVVACGAPAKQQQPIANSGAPPPPAAPERDMAQMRAEFCRCTDAACIDEVTKKWIAKAKEHGDRGKAPTDDDMRDAKAMAECAQKILTSSSPPPRGFTTGVVECDDVIVTYERYFQCDKLQAAGEAAIRAQRDALDAMKQGWAGLADAPQETKDAMAQGCKQALDGLRQGAAAMGCSI